MINSYSQNGEDKIMFEYFEQNFVLLYDDPTVIEFGANNGLDLSNSKLLVEKGFSAILIEPSGVFALLKHLHKDNPDVSCENVAVGVKNGTIDFYESGAHVPNGTDHALVSTTDQRELKRWPNVKFEKKTVQVVDVKTLRHKYTGNWDVISIDVEGLDWIVLQQINLNEVGCKILCIEWNSIPSLAKQFTNYCAKFGMKEIHRNAENLIFAKI